VVPTGGGAAQAAEQQDATDDHERLQHRAPQRPEPIAGGPSTAAARGPGRDRAGIDWGDGRKRSRGGNSRFFGGVKGESGKWRRFFFCGPGSKKTRGENFPVGALLSLGF
jgi:hypothetical protein